ncbi:NADP-dependent oxidoreductase domain-containing protein [Kockiozyma suomiensis]|uniref:NADP-dependent oxidoreductase domain-containing protein n=1 Tax=Kockiozyma suomiensis TaxID=1337062 RepID=UPI003343E873
MASLCTTSFKLNTGYSIPAIGLGTWQGTPGTDESELLQSTIKYALSQGYHCIDTAAAYEVEEDVRAAIAESEVPREEIFVVTKLWNAMHDRVEEAFLTSLQKLGLEYIDLYLMHWPMSSDDQMNVLDHPTPAETWLSMEALIKKYPTKLRSIGVSNFSEKTIKPLLEVATIIPAVNQIEIHPMLPQFELVDAFAKHGILTMAYSPLGQYNSPVLTHPDIIALAEKYKVPTGALVLSWEVQRGIVAVPKSTNKERIVSNITLLPELSPEDKKVLDEFHLRKGMHRRLCTVGNGVRPTGNDIVFGWTYEQLGWETFTVDE